MGDSDSGSSDNNRKHKKRRRRDRDDASSSESSYKRKKKKHRHKDRKKKSKKRSKDSSKRHSSRKDIDLPKRKVEEVSPLLSSEYLSPRQESNARQQSQQQQQEQLRKQEQARRMAPMSREEYQAQQSTIREIYDEQTGRYRLIRGTGEIIESLVSRSQHESINRQATRGDGATFSRDAFRAAHR